MTVTYVYEGHSGSVPPYQTAYEVAVDLPASVMYNLTYYNDLLGIGVSCVHRAAHQGGTAAPLPYVWNGTAGATIQMYDQTRGWIGFLSVTDLLSEFDSTRVEEPAGQLSVSTGRTQLNIANPVRFRIFGDTRSTPGYTITWTGLYLGLSDVCHIVRTTVDVLGVGDIGLWTAVGAPSPQAHPTLPNNAPLAGRNRVQVIS